MNNKSAKYLYGYRYYSPSFIFSSIILWFQVVPITLISATGHYSDRWIPHSLEMYSSSAILGSFVCWTFYVLFVLSSKIVILKRVLKSVGYVSNLNAILLRFLKLLSWILIFYSLYYFLDVGLGKIVLFGSALDPSEFRTLGWEERTSFETAMIQVGRRLILPFVFVYYYIEFHSTNSAQSKLLYRLSFVGILAASIATLDRGPFMLAFVMLVYLKFIRLNNLSKLVPLFVASIMIVVILSGFLTYIQHNIVDFSIQELLGSGIQFLYNRAYLSASTVPIELSYSLFPFDGDKLYLKYSRLLSLFTGNYVGSFEDASLFVGPVGAIADIWRNLGVVGVVVVPIILGRIFKWFDGVVVYMAENLRHAFTFTVITFMFYLIFGTFFSQGVFLQLLFMCFIALVHRARPVSSAHHADKMNKNIDFREGIHSSVDDTAGRAALRPILSSQSRRIFP